MGHRVPNHKSKCRNPHGHRYRLELTVRGAVIATQGDSSEGMVHDFGDLKTALTKHIHDVLDHGFMLAESDTTMRAFYESCDEEFRVVVVPFIPTAENIACWCYEQLNVVIPRSLKIARLRLFETPNSWADYLPENAE